MELLELYIEKRSNIVNLYKNDKEVKMIIKAEGEFDIFKTYLHYWTPKKIAEIINVLLDKELQVIILPTSKKTCDILIRDYPKERLS